MRPSSSSLWWRSSSSSSSSSMMMAKPDNRLLLHLLPFSMFSTKKTRVLFTSRLSLVLFFYLSVSLLSFPSIIHHANAEVGLNFGSEHDPLPMDLRGKVWRMMEGACFLGPANNLVVDPVFRSSGNDFMKPQELQFSHTGPRLCHWLDRLYEAHEALRYRWEAAHQKQKCALYTYLYDSPCSTVDNQTIYRSSYIRHLFSHKTLHIEDQQKSVVEVLSSTCVGFI